MSLQFSPPRLHAPVFTSVLHEAVVAQSLRSIAAARPVPAGFAAESQDMVTIPLTTVSLNSNFDAFVQMAFKGAAPGQTISLLVDSGNSTLIVPRWEDIAALPDGGADYQILGTGQEPWGCPANIVRGPICLPTASGATHEIPDCVFYACTGGTDRTANFGAACLSPWSASAWNTPGDIALQAPLAYDVRFPYVEFDYAAAADIHGPGPAPKVAGGSHLCLYRTLPEGYGMFDILPSLAWMALIPVSLSIQDAQTGWPGTVPSPIAVIDTGGGPVFLSDPNEYVCRAQWPDPVQNPQWTSTSDTCESVNDRLELVIGDGTGQFSYVIDPSLLPPATRGLTLVMCKKNYYLMEQQGMNIGGLSALVIRILIDYAQARVGLKAK